MVGRAQAKCQGEGLDPCPEGQQARARCECLAAQAQQTFLGPAHFARVMRAPSPDAVTAEDARKLRAAVAACDATPRAKAAR